MPVPLLSRFFAQAVRSWRGYALIVLIALAAGLPGLTRMPVLDRDEARFAQATRQMLETGDFVRIKLQQDDRNKKPIGIHWLQASAVAATTPITGKLNAIWAYRLPSLLGAALAACACFWAGCGLMDRRAAFVGAALFAGSILLGTEAMIGKTDAALAGFTTLALAALARLYVGSSRPKAVAMLFWAALGAGVLIKGPVTPMVAGLTLAGIGLFERRAAWMRPLVWAPGPLLAAAMVAPWMIAIGVATHGQFFGDAIGGDLAPKLGGGHEGHFAPPGTHLLLLPLLIFPATFALPAAARLAVQTIRSGRSEAAPLRFLIAWAGPTFLLFEALPTKLVHYTLPAYPAIALMCGAGLYASLAGRWRITSAIGFGLFALAGAGLVALLGLSGTFVPGDSDADLRRAVQGALAAGILLALALTAMITFTPRPAVRAAAALLVALAVSFSLRERLLPEARSLHVSVETVAALTRARLLPMEGRQLWSVGYGEMSLVFLTRTSIKIASPNVAGAEAAPGDALAVEARALQDTQAALSRRGLVFETVGAPVEGRNYGNGDVVRIYVGRAAAPEMIEHPLSGGAGGGRR